MSNHSDNIKTTPETSPLCHKAGKNKDSSSYTNDTTVSATEARVCNSFVQRKLIRKIILGSIGALVATIFFVEIILRLFTNSESITSLESLSTVSGVRNGAVATDVGICSEIGKTILEEKNGNAVDAAVASALCLGVVNPSSSGMGGGAFILIHMNHEGNETTEVIDCREEAPAASTYDMFEALPPEASFEGGLAIAVLGELRGLELAHQRHGSLPWDVVVEPAAELAEKGFSIPFYLGLKIEEYKELILRNAELAKMLTKNNDGKTLLKQKDILKQPTLGKTLRKIMVEGADAIYTGPMAKSMAQEIQSVGGIITYEDIQNYRPIVREPVIADDVSGFTIVGAPPPSSGGATMIAIARFLAGYKLPYVSFADTLSQHRLVEAMKHAFAMRMSLSDPAFYTNITTAIVKDMTQGSYMEELRLMTSDDHVLPLSSYGGSKWALLHGRRKISSQSKTLTFDNNRRTTSKESSNQNHTPQLDNKQSTIRQARLFQYLEDRGTSHLSIVDKDRNAVSLTSTINTHFGSGIVSPSTGIVLNSEMDDFATLGRPNSFGLAPSVSNYIAPHKRPLSSMSPTLIFRSNNLETDRNARSLGKLFLAVGASGGPKIITATLQTFLNLAFCGKSLFSSVTAPRLHDQLLYGGKPVTLFDDENLPYYAKTIEVSNRTKEALLKRGHKLAPKDYTGTCQAVSIDFATDTMTAVSDIRKYGIPAGY